MNAKILLGNIKSHAHTFVENEPIWLEKHRWDCGWYWAFGYIGNSEHHAHFDSLLHIKDSKDSKGEIKYMASKLFKTTNITDEEWWVIRDLFVQAYALQKAAEVYRRGGNQTARPGVTDIIVNKARADQINADLAKVLDTVWDFTCKAVNKTN